MHIDLFQSVHSNTTQPLLRENEFNGAIEPYRSELPYLSILSFLVTNAHLSLKLLHFDGSPVLLCGSIIKENKNVVKGREIARWECRQISKVFRSVTELLMSH